MNIRPNLFILSTISLAARDKIKNLLPGTKLSYGNARYNGDHAVAVQFYSDVQRNTILDIARKFAKATVIEIDSARLAHSVNTATSTSDRLGVLTKLTKDSPTQPHVELSSGIFGFGKAA